MWGIFILQGFEANYFTCFLGLYVAGSSPKALKSNGGYKSKSKLKSTPSAAAILA
jgi:hypothetical protein